MAFSPGLPCTSPSCLACRFVVLVSGTLIYGRGDDREMEKGGRG